MAQRCSKCPAPRWPFRFALHRFTSDTSTRLSSLMLLSLGLLYTLGGLGGGFMLRPQKGEGKGL